MQPTCLTLLLKQRQAMSDTFWFSWFSLPSLPTLVSSGSEPLAAEGDGAERLMERDMDSETSVKGREPSSETGGLLGGRGLELQALLGRGPETKAILKHLKASHSLLKAL